MPTSTSTPKKLLLRSPKLPSTMQQRHVATESCQGPRANHFGDDIRTGTPDRAGVSRSREAKNSESFI